MVEAEVACGQVGEEARALEPSVAAPFIEQIAPSLGASSAEGG